MLGVALLLAGGCAKSDESSNQAQRSKSGMMPDASPRYEATYVADPAQSKALPARTVSYEPLETFRAAKQAARAEAAEEPAADTDKDLEAADAGEKTEAPKTKKGKKPGGKGGLLQKLGDTLKGGAKGGDDKKAKPSSEKDKIGTPAAMTREPKKPETPPAEKPAANEEKKTEKETEDPEKSAAKTDEKEEEASADREDEDTAAEDRERSGGEGEHEEGGEEGSENQEGGDEGGGQEEGREGRDDGGG
jgi:hypothetical protein